MYKILVIEDESLLREMITELIEAEGFHCISAENGKIGVEAAKTHLPDLIVSDVKMPEMNGHQVLDELKKDPATSTIPFIFLSAMVDKKDLRKGMNLGADDYLTKPFDPDDLLIAIKTRLSKNYEIKKRMKELRESIALSLPHELQTPLISIIGYSQILMERHNNPNDQEFDFAKTINESGKRLNRLIQNFIAYSRFESAAKSDKDKLKEELEPIVISASSISALAIKTAGRYEREDDLKLQLKDAKGKIIYNDLAIVIEELLDNAFKFSDPETMVTIKNMEENNKYILTISDNGRGMTVEQISSIGAYIQFERKQYEQQGSGLGLTISKKIIELYGGSVEIKSIYGKETFITISIPSA